MTLVPALLALSPGVASAAAYPDNVAQPVNFGDAGFYGPAGGLTLNAPPVGMASTPTARATGSWPPTAASSPTATPAFFGSAGSIHLNKPIVGMAATPDGGGYWLVASDGGIFTYGDAGFYGSTGSVHLNSPIVGHGGHGRRRRATGWSPPTVASSPTATPGSSARPAPSTSTSPSSGWRRRPGAGYWLVASDGGIFTYGPRPFLGSMGGTPLVSPIVGMAASGTGYWLGATDGGVFNYGTGFLRLHGWRSNPNPIRAIAATPSGPGTGSCRRAPPAPPTVATRVHRCRSGLAADAALLLGYWVDTTSGNFDDSTQQAVWALQKAANLNPDGVVGPSTWAAVAAGVSPQPRARLGYQIQINLANDLIMVVNNGQVVWTLNTSTGGGYTYTEDGQTNVATTPTGVFQHVPGGRRHGDRLARHPLPAPVLLRGLRHPR